MKMKSSVFAAVGGVSALFLAVSIALASSGHPFAGEEFVEEVTKTTQYFLVEADGTSQIVDATNDKIIVMGKPAGTMVTTTGTDKCGSFNGAEGYETSAIGFSGTLNETWLVMLSSNDSKAARMPRIAAWIGTQPSPGKKISSVTLYQEHANDDGACVEDTRTYHKYTGSMD